MKRFALIFLSAFSTLLSFGQGDAEVNKSFMSSELKIYVVVAVLTIILAIIFGFLFSMERRVKKLEEKN